MRIVCLCNNWLGWKVLQWLSDQDQQIVALVLNAGETAKYEDEIRSVIHGTKCPVFEANQIREPKNLEQIRSLRPDIGISVLFRNLLKQSFLDLFPKGCINLHPAFLPYNRGSNPNVWSIVEKTPAGATLHYVDANLDTGDIITQKKVVIEPTDTGRELYRKLECAALELFQESWPRVQSGNCPRTKQDANAGTYHRQKDLERIDEIDLEKSYRGEDLINVLRARSFAPYKGAYFRYQGRKIYLRLELWEG
jgi:methionyl-tRNA formyltransferase